MRVFTLSISHRHGDDLMVYGSEQEAESALFSYVRDNWSVEMQDQAMPDDEAQAVADYFNAVPDETSNIEGHEIAPVGLNTDEAKGAALALDYSGKIAVLHAIEEASGLIPCVVLSAQDVLDEAREDMEGKFGPIDEEGDEAAAEHLTVEMALDTCRSVAEDDWSDTSSEASHRAKRRLMRAARDAARVGATVAT